MRLSASSAHSPQIEAAIGTRPHPSGLYAAWTSTLWPRHGCKALPPTPLPLICIHPLSSGLATTRGAHDPCIPMGTGALKIGTGCSCSAGFVTHNTASCWDCLFLILTTLMLLGLVFSAAFSQAPPSSQGLQSMVPREPLSSGTASICFCVHAQLGACWWQGTQVGLKAQGVQVQGCDVNGRLRTEGYGWLSLATINFGPQQHCLTTWRPIQPSASSKLRSVFQGDPHPALLTSKSPQERAAGWSTSPSVGRSGWNMPGATTRGLQMHL